MPFPESCPGGSTKSPSHGKQRGTTFLASAQGYLEIAPPNLTIDNSHDLYAYGPSDWSANGTEVVGRFFSYQPSWDVYEFAGMWYWSPSRGFVSLPDGIMPIEWWWPVQDQIRLSGDGQVAVGTRIATGEFWRWSTDGTTQFSGEVPYHTSARYNEVVHIHRVSHDGSMVVGAVVWDDMDGHESIPIRWSKAGGFSRLNVLAEAAQFSFCNFGRH